MNLRDFPYSKFAPVARSGGHPKLKVGSKAYDDYWDEQEEYILNGFTIGGETISGAFYHWLNYYKIDFVDEYKSPIRIYPLMSDVDREAFYTLDQCRKYDNDFLVLKVRDKGFSNILASESLRMMQFVKGAKVGAVFPGGQSKAQNNFKEKFFDALNDYPDAMRVNSEVDNAGVLTFGYTIVDSHTKMNNYVGQQSRIAFFDAVSKDVLKSDRYNLGIIDEAGEIDILQSLLDTSVANFRKGAMKTGTLIVGGTTNQMNKGHHAFRSLFFNAEERGFQKMFIPGWRKYFPFVNSETGESLEVEAKEDLDKHRSKAKKVGVDAYTEFLQNYGNTIEEVFTNNNIDILDKSKLTGQAVRLLSEDSYKGITQRGNLVERLHTDGSYKIEFMLDAHNGRWEVFQHSLSTLLNTESVVKKKDYVGVDSVYKDIAPQSDSKCAIVVYRPFIDVNTVGRCIVCVYHYRHNVEGGKELFYDDLRLTLEYYNAKALVETTDEELFRWFQKRGILPKYIKETPTPANYNKFRKSLQIKDYGINPNGEPMNLSAKLLKNEVDLRSGNIMFTSVCNDLMNWGHEGKNSDIGDAFKWALLYADGQTTENLRPEVPKVNERMSSLPRYRHSGAGLEQVRHE